MEKGQGKLDSNGASTSGAATNSDFPESSLPSEFVVTEQTVVQEDKTQCPICLDSCEDCGAVTVCGHYFCSDCIHGVRITLLKVSRFQGLGVLGLLSRSRFGSRSRSRLWSKKTRPGAPSAWPRTVGRSHHLVRLYPINKDPVFRDPKFHVVEGSKAFRFTRISGFQLRK